MSYPGKLLDYILMMCGLRKLEVKRQAGLTPASLPNKSVGWGCFPDHEPQLRLFHSHVPIHFSKLKSLSECLESNLDVQGG